MEWNQIFELINFYLKKQKNKNQMKLIFLNRDLKKIEQYNING